MDGILARHRATFRAVAVAVVPELAAADDASWAEIEATVERVLSSRPTRQRRQLELLFRVLGLLSLARFGRSLEDVAAAPRERFLATLQRSPLRLVRRGIWGIRTLVFMGHYTRPRIIESVGYHANPRGWSAREPRAATHGPEVESRS